MNRTECEKKIEELMREAWGVYKQYNPDGNYLTMDILDGHMSANNSTWAEDKYRPIRIFTPVAEAEDREE